jgi:hypothetical protein
VNDKNTHLFARPEEEDIRQGEGRTDLALLGTLPLKIQYRARPPDMSNTAPVLNEQAAEQSHKTIPATSATLPRRFSGLAITMVFTTSGPNLRMSSVSIGPGATQFTRIPVSQTSRDRAFVNAITPALAAEYVARLGNPSLPASPEKSYLDIHGRLRIRRLLAKSHYFATEMTTSAFHLINDNSL